MSSFDRGLRWVAVEPPGDQEPPALAPVVPGGVETYATPPVDEVAAWKATLAARVREAYFRERRRQMRLTEGRTTTYGEGHVPEWDGGRNPTSGYNKQPIWPKIVDFLLSHGITAIDQYVTVALEFHTKARPPDLMRDVAVVRFRRTVDESDDRLVELFRSDTNIYQSAIMRTSAWFPDLTEQQVWEHALGNHMFELSPLFRYSVAVSESYKGIAEQMRQLALEQLLGNIEGYKRSWAGAIPEELINAAETLLPPLKGPTQ